MEINHGTQAQGREHRQARGIGGGKDAAQPPFQQSSEIGGGIRSDPGPQRGSDRREGRVGGGAYTPKPACEQGCQIRGGIGPHPAAEPAPPQALGKHAFLAMQITKFEAARRQLVTGIRLFFEDADSISVYTLGHAAWEVLDALCKHQGKIRFREQMADANALTQAEIKKIATFGKNFVKHADWDPDALLEDFDDTLNDHVLISAAMDFGTLASTKPMEVQLYPIWYFAAYPEKIARPDYMEMQDGAAKLFPGLAALDRKRQKAAGLTALLKALRDPELMAHPFTDRSPVRGIAAS
jgi:hypothetical protein